MKRRPTTVEEAKKTYLKQLRPTYRHIEQYLEIRARLARSIEHNKEKRDRTLNRILGYIPFSNSPSLRERNIRIQGMENSKAGLEQAFSEVFDTEIKQGEIYLYTDLPNTGLEQRIGVCIDDNGKAFSQGPLDNHRKPVDASFQTHSSTIEVLARLVMEFYHHSIPPNYPVACISQGNIQCTGYIQTDGTVTEREGNKGRPVGESYSSTFIPLIPAGYRLNTTGTRH